MMYFLQQVITGLSIGGIYSLLAVGYALIYSVFDFSNFAFGCVMMISAFTGYYGMTLFHLPMPQALAISVIIGVAVSLGIELIAYRPLRRKKTARLFLMITGIGIDLAIVNTATLLLSGNYRPFPGLSTQAPIVLVSGLTVGRLDIFASVFSVVALILLWLFIEKTKSGLAIRASAYDSSVAGMMGINVNRISIIVFIISGITAAIAGIFFGMKYAVYPTLGTVSMKAFIASVIGGLGSLPGAVLGGMILGIMETLISGYISSLYRDLFSYGLLILVLFFLPNGILGVSSQDKI